ncbi:hypothetical protein CMU04_06030 [Elizabethkingia anophelis]|uniref:hypothetical protein n=1 Tax=Elizabethkingia anophelis TaxID=1117645 RepID=UPI0024050FED|nr:hypothetical protein [Elizabethkingia anophelis]MDV3882876.1 hypothetical protein [Elizabethkingia anophelis]
MRASEANNMIQLILSQLSEKDKQQLKLQLSGETVDEKVDDDAFLLFRNKHFNKSKHVRLVMKK